jgi:hypothetical protein
MEFKVTSKEQSTQLQTILLDRGYKWDCGGQLHDADYPYHIQTWETGNLSRQNLQYDSPINEQVIFDTDMFIKNNEAKTQEQIRDSFLKPFRRVLMSNRETYILFQNDDQSFGGIRKDGFHIEDIHNEVFKIQKIFEVPLYIHDYLNSDRKGSTLWEYMSDNQKKIIELQKIIDEAKAELSELESK